VKGIKVGLESTVELLWPGKGWEKDVIFEREGRLEVGDGSGVVLEEGVQRWVTFIAM